MPPFPRSSLAHRTGDPSIFARPSAERIRGRLRNLTIRRRIKHIAAKRSRLGCDGRRARAALQVSESARLPAAAGQKQEGDDAIFCKNNHARQADAKEASARSAARSLRLERVRNKSLPWFPRAGGGIVCSEGPEPSDCACFVSGDCFLRLPASPVHSEQVPPRAAAFVQARGAEPVSAQRCTSMSNFSRKRRHFGETSRQKEARRPF